MNNSQDIAVIEKLTDVLDSLNIGYAIGGSLASSVYGAVRFTRDADITIGQFTSVAEKFYEAIERDFYISKETMYKALQTRGSFNIIHFATAFKIDIFIQAANEFQKTMLTRSRKLKLGDGAKTVSFVSPEDIILLKLDWFRQSGCTSERQWPDIQGVMNAQADLLDCEYLQKWAEKLGVGDLLRRAMDKKKTC